MTHTVHPYAHRLGIIRDWKSRWFAKSPAKYRENVMVDSAIRRFLKKRLRGSYVTSVEIERNEKAIPHFDQNISPRARHWSRRRGKR
jgi:small subunit ribosomal protein S3